MILELDSEFRETLSVLSQRSGIYGAMLAGLSRYASLSDAGRFVGYDLGKSMRQIYYLQKVGREDWSWDGWNCGPNIQS